MAETEDLQIKVGTLGVFSLEGKDIYFDPDHGRLPVPRYVYKIITTVSTGERQVYVFNNNPYETLENIVGEIEKTFGDKAVELSGGFVDVTKGYTFMVPFDDFVNVVDVTLSDPNYKRIPIPLTQGYINVIQHHEELHVLQVSYFMESRHGKVKGIFESFQLQKSSKIFNFIQKNLY